MNKLAAALLAFVLTLAPALAQNGMPGGPGAQVPNNNGPSLPLSVANGGTGDTGTVCVPFTPTVTFTGGTGANSTGSTGCYKQLAAKVLWVQYTLVINFTTAPTSFNVTLPNSLTSGAAGVLVGQSQTSGVINIAGVAAGSTVSNSVVNGANGAFPVAATGNSLFLTGVISNQ